MSGFAPPFQQHSAFRAQIARAAHVNMHDLVGAAGGVPMDQHANTALQAAGDGHLVRADQRGVEPAKLARGDGRKLGVQIGCGAEDCAGNVFDAKIVLSDQPLEQVAGGLENSLARVGVGGGCAANTPAEIGHRFLLHTTEEAWSLSLHASGCTSFSHYSTRSSPVLCSAGIKVVKAKKGLVAMRLHCFLFASVIWQTIAWNRSGVNRHFWVLGIGDWGLGSE